MNVWTDRHVQFNVSHFYRYLSRQITIIHEPEEFYSTLLEKCRHANKRITLASLYIGTGALETELVGITKTNLIKNMKTLRIFEMENLIFAVSTLRKLFLL